MSNELLKYVPNSHLTTIKFKIKISKAYLNVLKQSDIKKRG